MAKDGEFLAFQVVGTDGYYPVNFVRCPFLPGATVEPDLELKSFLPYLTYGPEDGVGTNPVRTVWVGKVAGHVDLRRFEPLEQGNNVGNVLRMDGGLGNGAGPVKAEVHEFQMFRRDAAGQGCRPSFRLPNQRLDLEHILRIGLSWLLGPQKTLHPFLDRLCMVLVNREQAVKLHHEIGETPGIMVENGDVAAGHVGNMDLVIL